MPVRIYAPASGQSGAPYATIVLSHGKGGAIGAFDTLSAYLTSHGYICLMIQHDDARAFSRVERPLDVTFAINQLLASPTNALLAGRVDATRIAHCGHSFGAFTTLAMLGARYRRTDNVASTVVSYPDERVKCGVALSPQGAETLGLFSGSWDHIARPSLSMHGTLDTADSTDVPATRRQPYDEMPVGNKVHITMQDGVHSDFTDNGIANSGNYYSQWYLPAILAFLDTHLNNDATAAAWLDALTLSRLSSNVAVLETK
jgi:predicted dienelactone hydrolase